MKAVLLSIQPKWCELIASGKKTLEVRKTKPKLETPFKCYIYCTKGFKSNTPYSYKTWAWYGKIIGEFICDKIDTVACIDTPCIQYITVNDKMDVFFPDISCLDVDTLGAYLGLNKEGYGWHISNLVIYDEPKGLEVFATECKHFYDEDDFSCIGCCYRDRQSDEITGVYSQCICNGLKPIKVPQSWCYVEESEG